MKKMDDKSDGTLKTSAGRRSRTGRAGRGPATPRVMVVAALVIIAGGAALFWPRGGTVPTGIGENQTTVSTTNNATGTESSPRSGDVDINSEGAPDLKPEPSKDDLTTNYPAETKTLDIPPPAAQLKPTTTKTETTEPETTKPETTKPNTSKPVEIKTTTKPAPKPTTSKPPSQPKIKPQATGPFAVQAGAFGKAENADKEAARLKALGWDTRVLAKNNSNGEMVFRVRIGFFSSRQEAQTFINQNSRHLSGAIPVHR